MTNEQDAAGQPEHAAVPEHHVPAEHVLPPTPADAAESATPPSVPLAPPLSSPAGPPPPLQWPGAPVQDGPSVAVPPYASAYPQHPSQEYPPSGQPGYPQPGYPQQNYPQQGYPQQGYPQSAPYAAGAYPLASSAPPPARSGGRTLAVILGVVGGLVMLGVVGVAVAVSLFLGATPSTPIAVPSPTAVQPSEPSAGPDDADPDGGSDAPADPEAGSAIADRLEDKIDEYKRLRDSGELWQSIPDTEFNRTAVSAFLYFLTDMKVATIWGVDAATADEYEQRMTMLEERLLAQQPLGDDIEITLEDKVFTYDGETGEGGYTPK